MTRQEYNLDQLLHGLIEKKASITVGLDILEEDAAKLREQGHDIRYGNAENFELGESFDVIFAGELIEHLQNFDGFFKSCKKHMHEQSLLILTTPNCFGINYFTLYLFGRRNVNLSHTCWFCLKTLTHLLSRFNFQIIHNKFALRDNPRNTLFDNVMILFEKTFPKLAPRLFIVCKNLEE